MLNQHKGRRIGEKTGKESMPNYLLCVYIEMPLPQLSAMFQLIDKTSQSRKMNI